MLSGELEVESVLGTGSTFRLILPSNASEGARTTAPAEREAGAEGAGQAREPQP
jgi:hypothetical protein